MSDDGITNDEILDTLPERLRLVRLRLGWTQEELAEHSGVGVKTISSFENGSRTFAIKLQQLIDIATACGYDIRDLLTDPLESFGISAAVLQEIDRKRRHGKKYSEDDERPFRLVRPPRGDGRRKKVSPPTPPKRGVTIFRSSDHLGSSLGEPRR